MPAERAQLLDLAERVASLTQSERWMDAEIAVAIRWKVMGPMIKHWVHDWPAGLRIGELEGYVYLADAPVPDTKWKAPEFTRSLDAAASLYDEVPTLIHSNPRWVVRDALRALAAQHPEEGGA